MVGEPGVAVITVGTLRARAAGHQNNRNDNSGGACRDANLGPL